MKYLCKRLTKPIYSFVKINIYGIIINYMREVAILKAFIEKCKFYKISLVEKLRIDKNTGLFMGIYRYNLILLQN